MKNRDKQPVNIVISMTSLQIAELTGKEHFHVLRDIENMLRDLKVVASNFGGYYKASNGKTNPMYILPKRETLILVSGYSTELRAKIIDRIEYLEKENELLKNELALKEKARNEARLEYKPMTKALLEVRQSLGKETQHFHYSNESNLIYIIVLGGTCKKVKEEYCLGNLDNLRDNLTPQQIASVQDMQKLNTSLIDIGMSYDERKDQLKKVFNRKWSQILIDEHIRLEA